MNPFDFALQFVGQKEIRGPNSNQIILEMIQEHSQNTIDDSKLAWCSIFGMKICDLLRMDRTGATMAARSWLKVGKKIPTLEAKQGDVFVIDRHGGPDWWAHMGFFGAWDLDGNPVLCSGNYGNAVSVDPFPIKDVLGVIRVS